MGVPVQCLNVLKNNRMEDQNRNSFLQLLFFAQSTTNECSSIASAHLGGRGGGSGQKCWFRGGQNPPNTFGKHTRHILSVQR